MIFNFNTKTEITHSFEESDFNQLTTVSGVTGDNLQTIYGNGYIILRKTAGTDAQPLSVYIDGNTQPFTVPIQGATNVIGNTLRLYFQESIRFTAYYDNVFYYQTLLTDKEIPKRYDIIQGASVADKEFSFTGRGKIIMRNGNLGISHKVEIDGKSMYVQSNANHYIDILFTESFKCTSSQSLHYIAYIEK